MKKKIHHHTLAIAGMIFLSASYSRSNIRACEITESKWTALHSSYQRQANDQNYEKLVIVKSFSGLKNMNTYVFNNWTRGSEYLTTLMHFFFQKNLYNDLSRHEVIFLEANVPYLKNLEIKLSAHNQESWNNVAEATFTAKQASSIAIARAIFSAGELGIRQLEQQAHQSPHHNIRLLNGSSQIASLSSSEMKIFVNNIQKYFPTEQSFIDYMIQQYNIGLGSSVMDANVASRLASNRSASGGKAAIFNFKDFQKIVYAIKTQESHLQWLLKNKTETELLEIYNLLRFNIHRPINQWNGKMNQLVETVPTHLIPPHESPHEFFKRRLTTFLKTLNYLDYLPPEFVQQDPKMTTNFNSLSQVNLSIFMDLKGLGARNFMVLQHKATEVMQRISEIDRLQKSLSSQSENILAQEKLAQLIHELDNVRRLILRESNEFLQLKIQAIQSHFYRNNLTEREFRIWQNGDDIHINLRLPSHINREAFLKDLLEVQSLAYQARVIYTSPDPLSPFPLDKARLLLGEPVTFLKSIEELRLSHPVVLEMKDHKSIKIHWFEHNKPRLAPLPETYLEALTNATSYWRIK